MSFRDKTDKLLDIALSDSFFGEKDKVKYLPTSGGTYVIRGIFDESWEEVDVNADVMVSSTQPNVGILLRELLPIKPKQGDSVVVRGCKFEIADVQVDGQGGATLFLHRS